MRLEGAAYRRMWFQFYSGIGGFGSIAFYIGWWIERNETNRMSRFRDKSALYGRELAPGEPPSWGS